MFSSILKYSIFLPCVLRVKLNKSQQVQQKLPFQKSSLREEQNREVLPSQDSTKIRKCCQESTAKPPGMNSCTPSKANASMFTFPVETWMKFTIPRKILGGSLPVYRLPSWKSHHWQNAFPTKQQWIFYCCVSLPEFYLDRGYMIIWINMIRICCRILYSNDHLITIWLNHSSKLHLAGISSF